MAKENSFDIVSEVDLQEVDNAVNQAKKEIMNRYDFRGSKAEITLEKETIVVIADDKFKLNAVLEILRAKLVKRGISLKNIEEGKIEDAAGMTVKMILNIKKGLSTEYAKELSKFIKQQKLKVNAQIMDNQVRVSGKDKDELQRVIQLVKGLDFHVDLQFVNYR